MNKSPLLFSALFWTVGLIGSFYFSFPFWTVFVLALLSLTLGSCLSDSKSASVFLGALLIFLGLLRGQLAAFQTPSGVTHFLQEGETVRLVGIVQTDPFLKGGKNSFDLRCLALKEDSKWKSVSGRLRIFASEKPVPPYGEEVMVEGVFRKPRTPGNPGEFNLAAYFERKGLDGTLSVKAHHGFISLGKNHATPLSRRLFFFRRKMLYQLYESLPKEEGSLLGAMMLGDRAELKGELWDLFTRTGTVHLLSISGLHVGIFATLIYSLFKRLRLRRAVAFCFTCFFLVGYAALVGGSPPVVRSTVMILLYLWGTLLGREVFFLNIFSLAYLLLLIWNPHSIADVGFQLSFLSIFFLFLTHQQMKPFLKRERPAPFFRRLRAYGAELFVISVGVWFGIWPVVSYYFSVVSPVSWFANCLVIPLLFPIIGFGALWLLLGSIFPVLSMPFLRIEEILLFLLMGSIRFFDKIPYGSMTLSVPGIPFLAVYYSLLGIFLLKPLQHLRWKMVVVILFLGNLWLWGTVLKESEENLEVTFLDVGHGDAIFLQFPGGRNLLIDGGDRRENFDAGRQVITPFLRKKNIRKLDAVLVTHADQDHIGGIPTILKNFHPDYVFESGFPKESKAYREYRETLEALRLKPIFLHRGQKISGYGGAILEVLHPPAPFLEGTERDENSNGVVLKLTHGETRFLFSADIEGEAIRELIQAKQELHAEILKMPHHGSDLGEEGAPFLKAVSPSAVIMSVGEKEPYHLPSSKTLSLLDDFGIKTYQTVSSGAIFLVSDGKKISVETWREEK